MLTSDGGSAWHGEGDEPAARAEEGQTARVRQLTSLFEGQRQRLRREAARYVGWAGAEDIVQDAFLAVWRANKRADDMTVAYVRRVVRNRALDAARRMRRFTLMHRRLQAESLATGEGRAVVADAALIPGSIDRPDTEVEAMAEAEWLNYAVQRLPPQQARVFRLHREEGWNYKRIAQSLGISERTVETHMRRALQALRAQWHAASR